jgi:hypothetical protein
MGVLGVLLVCVLVSAALSSELRERYAALLRALAAALSTALRGAQPPAQGNDAAGSRVAEGASADASGSAPATRSAGAAQPLPALPCGAVEAWSVADVGAWLRCIELGEHAAAFATASVDGALLLGLTPEELRALGVASPLHAKKIRLRLLMATAAAQQVRRRAHAQRSASACGRGVCRFARARSAPPAPHECYARARSRA